MYVELTALSLTLVTLMAVDWVNTIELYHYTTQTNYLLIVSSGVIRTSRGRKYFPEGVYLTELNVNKLPRDEIAKEIWGSAGQRMLEEGRMNSHVCVRIPTNDPNLVATGNFWRYEGDLRLSDYWYSTRTYSEECWIDKAALITLVVALITFWGLEDTHTSTESTPTGPENCPNCGISFDISLKRKGVGQFDIHTLYCS